MYENFPEKMKKEENTEAERNVTLQSFKLQIDLVCGGGREQGHC